MEPVPEPLALSPLDEEHDQFHAAVHEMLARNEGLDGLPLLLLRYSAALFSQESRDNCATNRADCEYLAASTQMKVLMHRCMVVMRELARIDERYPWGDEKQEEMAAEDTARLVSILSPGATDQEELRHELEKTRCFDPRVLNPFWHKVLGTRVMLFQTALRHLCGAVFREVKQGGGGTEYLREAHGMLCPPEAISAMVENDPADFIVRTEVALTAQLVSWQPRMTDMEGAANTLAWMEHAVLLVETAPIGVLVAVSDMLEPLALLMTESATVARFATQMLLRFMKCTFVVPSAKVALFIIGASAILEVTDAEYWKKFFQLLEGMDVSVDHGQYWVAALATSFLGEVVNIWESLSEDRRMELLINSLGLDFGRIMLLLYRNTTRVDWELPDVEGLGLEGSLRRASASVVDSLSLTIGEVPKPFRDAVLSDLHSDEPGKMEKAVLCVGAVNMCCDKTAVAPIMMRLPKILQRSEEKLLSIALWAAGRCIESIIMHGDDELFACAAVGMDALVSCARNAQDGQREVLDACLSSLCIAVETNCFKHHYPELLALSTTLARRLGEERGSYTERVERRLSLVRVMDLISTILEVGRAEARVPQELRAMLVSMCYASLEDLGAMMEAASQFRRSRPTSERYQRRVEEIESMDEEERLRDWDTVLALLEGAGDDGLDGITTLLPAVGCLSGAMQDSKSFMHDVGDSAIWREFTAMVELCWELFVTHKVPGSVTRYLGLGTALLDIVSSFVETGKEQCRDFLVKHQVMKVVSKNLSCLYESTRQSACALIGEVIRCCPDILGPDEALVVARLFTEMLDGADLPVASNSLWALSQVVEYVPGWLEEKHAIDLMERAMGMLTSRTNAMYLQSNAAYLWVSVAGNQLERNEASGHVMPHIEVGIRHILACIRTFIPGQTGDQESRKACINVLKVLTHFPDIFLPNRGEPDGPVVESFEEPWANLLLFVVLVVNDTPRVLSDEPLCDALHQYFFTVKRKCGSRWDYLTECIGEDHPVRSMLTGCSSLRTFMEKWAVPRSWSRELHCYFPASVRAEIGTLVTIATHVPENVVHHIPPELMELLYKAIADATLLADAALPQ